MTINSNPVHEEIVTNWPSSGGAGTLSDPVYIGGGSICGITNIDASTLLNVDLRQSEDGVTFYVISQNTELDAGPDIVGTFSRGMSRVTFAIGPWLRLAVTSGTVTAGDQSGVLIRPRTGI